jgi:predicted nucleic acid-binding protein
VIVVADTSPLNYLIGIGCDHVLPALYGRLLLPSAVMRELNHLRAPSSVKAWLNSVPDGIEVCDPPATPDPTLGFLHDGERRADLILIDERKGSVEAERRGLLSTGTLGVLLSAGNAGLIDPLKAYRRLASETTFRTSASLERAFLVLLAK